jgi:hypothetical protein
MYTQDSTFSNHSPNATPTTTKKKRRKSANGLDTFIDSLEVIIEDTNINNIESGNNEADEPMDKNY